METKVVEVHEYFKWTSDIKDGNPIYTDHYSGPLEELIAESIAENIKNGYRAEEILIEPGPPCRYNSVSQCSRKAWIVFVKHISHEVETQRTEAEMWKGIADQFKAQLAELRGAVALFVEATSASVHYGADSSTGAASSTAYSANHRKAV